MIVEGARLGGYEVLGPLGAGGMGEVYRARDTQLEREVALKVLPDDFVRDRDRVARFEREARVLASLNHPNIAVLYGLEEANGVRFLVMELVSGNTLAERLASSPLALGTALDVGRQIAEALEVAHEKGIVHRDLKPANVLLTPEGKAKVVDFGLAKVFAGEGEDSATITKGATREGAVLGTPAYMSPEQARGQAVDKRTDVWAFGCVLYEMLTGLRAFAGKTSSDTITAILTGDPDWQALPRGAPVRIRDLLRKCVQKEPHRRLRDLGDARIEIEEAVAELSARSVGPGIEGLRRKPRRWLAAGLLAGAAALMSGLVVWNVVHRQQPTPRPVRRFAIQPSTSSPLSSQWNITLALSPDGSHLVYTAIQRESTLLYVRALDEFETRPLAGTEGAYDPFFSPDGQWVAFWAAGKLRKVSLTGGGAITLYEGNLLSGCWGADGAILLGSRSGIWRIPPEGGPPKAVTRVDLQHGEISHLFPEALPDAKAVLFTIQTRKGPDDSRIAVESLTTGQQRILIEGGAQARYSPTGHLIYARSGTLFAAPFDPVRLEVKGTPFPILDGVLVGSWTKVTQFTFANDGSFAYVPAGRHSEESSLVWVDRKGLSETLPLPSRAFGLPRLSPDGQSVAVQVQDGAREDIWVYRRASDTFNRLTFVGSNMSPLWTPDGRRLAFTSTAGPSQGILWQPADGSTPPARLLSDGQSLWAESWTPDGRTLIVARESPTTGSDIFMVNLPSDTLPDIFIGGPSDQFGARVSPDGHWIAYVSDESGRFEVYLQPLPGPGGKRQVSTEGGTEVVWARNGRELFFRIGDAVMTVPVETRPDLTVGKPSLLFEAPYVAGAPGLANYDAAPDGQGLLMVKRSDMESARRPIYVVENWFEELKRSATRVR